MSRTTVPGLSDPGRCANARDWSRLGRLRHRFKLPTAGLDLGVTRRDTPVTAEAAHCGAGRAHVCREPESSRHRGCGTRRGRRWAAQFPIPGMIELTI